MKLFCSPFSDAQTLCSDYGGLLAEIRDEDEMTMLRTRILRKYVKLLCPQVVFSVGCWPKYQTISSYLMTNSRISIGKMVPWVFFTFSSLIQISQLKFWKLKKFILPHYFTRKQHNLLLGIWPMIQYSICFHLLTLLISSTMCTTGAWGHKTFASH